MKENFDLKWNMGSLLLFAGSILCIMFFGPASTGWGWLMFLGVLLWRSPTGECDECSEKKKKDDE